MPHCDASYLLVVNLLSGTFQSVPDLTSFGGSNALTIESGLGSGRAIQAGWPNSTNRTRVAVLGSRRAHLDPQSIIEGPGGGLGGGRPNVAMDSEFQDGLFDSLRHRPSQARLRATTHRCGSTSKLFAGWERLTISTVYSPFRSSAPQSSGPASPSSTARLAMHGIADRR